MGAILSALGLGTGSIATGTGGAALGAGVSELAAAAPAVAAAAPAVASAAAPAIAAPAVAAPAIAAPSIGAGTGGLNAVGGELSGSLEGELASPLGTPSVVTGPGGNVPEFNDVFAKPTSEPPSGLKGIDERGADEPYVSDNEGTSSFSHEENIFSPSVFGSKVVGFGKDFGLQLGKQLVQSVLSDVPGGKIAGSYLAKAFDDPGIKSLFEDPNDQLSKRDDIIKVLLQQQQREHRMQKARSI